MRGHIDDSITTAHEERDASLSAERRHVGHVYSIAEEKTFSSLWKAKHGSERSNVTFQTLHLLRPLVAAANICVTQTFYSQTGRVHVPLFPNTHRTPKCALVQESVRVQVSVNDANDMTLRLNSQHFSRSAPSLQTVETTVFPPLPRLLRSSSSETPSADTSGLPLGVSTGLTARIERVSSG